MIFAEFIHWYYYKAPLDIIIIWRNFLFFSYHFFGIPYHLATFFRPWRLVVVQFEEQGVIRRFFFNLAGKMIGIGIGMTMRSLTIFLGLVTMLALVIGGVFFVFVWLLLPAGLILGFLQGAFFVI